MKADTPVQWRTRPPEAIATQLVEFWRKTCLGLGIGLGIGVVFDVSSPRAMPAVVTEPVVVR